MTLPSGSKLDSAAVNAVPAVCSERSLATTCCPAGSQIGTREDEHSVLTQSEMTGSIYLMDRTNFKFGYILRGARTAHSMVRGTATQVASGPVAAHNDLVAAAGAVQLGNFQLHIEADCESADVSDAVRLREHPRVQPAHNRRST